MPLAAAAVGLAGAAISAKASKKAAGAQVEAADKASAAEREMFEQSRADQAPWRDRGNAAGERLNYLLGLSGGGGQGVAPQTAPQTREQIRANLLPKYTTPATGLENSGLNSGPFALLRRAATQMTPERVDEAGLNAAVEAEFAKQQSAQNAIAGPGADPAYGSLLRRFSAADLQADPVYQSGLEFGLNEGRNALQRMAAARGGLNSGATLKALTRFGNDYGSTKANESYNRFNNDMANTYNRLAGVSGTGQTSAAQIGSQAIQTGHNIGQNITDAGNARASGYVGGANAITGAIGKGINTWQQNELIKRLPYKWPTV